jgi:hypothetical protein
MVGEKALPDRPNGFANILPGSKTAAAWRPQPTTIQKAVAAAGLIQPLVGHSRERAHQFAQTTRRQKGTTPKGRLRTNSTDASA